MRLSEFWTLADEEFGPLHSRTLVRDHVLSRLGNRTAEVALTAGEDPREVWVALCDEFEIPAERRWGALDNPARRR